MDAETTIDGAQMAEVVLHGLAHRHRHVHLHLVADLSRTFDQGTLRQALSKVVDTFPVLGCRYRPGFFRDRWVRWSGDIEELMGVRTSSNVELETRHLVRRQLPHQERPPWMVTLIEHPDGCRLVLSAHHMIVDGGGLKALAHVLAASLCGRECRMPTSQDRSLLQAARGLRISDFPVLLSELAREALQPLSTLRVRPIGGHALDEGSATPRWSTVDFSTEDSIRFVEALRHCSATVNDGLVAAVALMSARRAQRGPVMAGYTVDLRKHLSEPRLIATNLHGICLAVLRRKALQDEASVLVEVSRCIGEQKRRLHGLAYALLNSLAFGWFPHSLLRLVGRAFIDNLLSYLNRGLVVTNIGPLDDALAPFGDDLRSATVVGPFVHGLPVPVLTATGLRSDVSLQICSTGSVGDDAVEGYATELSDVLRRIAGIG